MSSYISCRKNNLTVLKYIPSSKELRIPYPCFLCLCDCGNLCLKEVRAFKENRCYSCGTCNKELQKCIDKYKSYNEFNQKDLEYLLKIPVFKSRNSKYENFEDLKLENIQVLKYLSSLKDWGSCYICKCFICNQLFLAPCHHLYHGNIKSCGNSDCRKIIYAEKTKVYDYDKKKQIKVYIDFDDFEKQKRIKEINEKYYNVIYHEDKFLRVLNIKRYKSGDIAYKIEVQCSKCGNKRAVDLGDWKYQKSHYTICDCKKKKNYKRPCPNYEFLKIKNENYTYLGKSRIKNGKQYIWLLCKNCNIAIEVDGSTYTNFVKYKDCCCFKKPVKEKRKSTYSKYSLEEYKKGDKINGLTIWGIFKTNNAFKAKGDLLFVMECPFCGDRFGRDFYSIKDGHCKSCGCINTSLGEEMTYEILKEICKEKSNFTVSREKSFKGLIGLGGGLLKFDFCLYKDYKIYALIEFNGLEHYDEKYQINIRDKNKAKETLHKIQEHDNRKIEFCKKNNIPLCSIKYTLKHEVIRKEILDFLGGL